MIDLELKTTLRGSKLDDVIKAGLAAQGYTVKGPLVWGRHAASEPDGMHPGCSAGATVEVTVEPTGANPTNSAIEAWRK